MQKEILINASQNRPTNVFHNSVEKPLEKSFADWIIMGTICGALSGLFGIVEHGNWPTTICAAMSFAAVGAISGWLVFALFDVVANGRLEVEVELPTDETKALAESCSKLEPNQITQQPLSKAS